MDRLRRAEFDHREPGAAKPQPKESELSPAKHVLSDAEGTQRPQRKNIYPNFAFFLP
jgi:hypothetical protein